MHPHEAVNGTMVVLVKRKRASGKTFAAGRCARTVIWVSNKGWEIRFISFRNGKEVSEKEKVVVRDDQILALSKRVEEFFLELLQQPSFTSLTHRDRLASIQTLETAYESPDGKGSIPTDQVPKKLAARLIKADACTLENDLLVFPHLFRRPVTT